MTSAEPDSETIRQQLTEALGHDLDETSWQVLLSLSLEILGELTWRSSTSTS
jgi:hypothetical protein